MSLIQPVKGYCFLYSDGSDGAFYASTNMIVDLPPDGIFNFTTITIDDGVIVNFNRNADNTPVYFLATGEVIINGIINISTIGAMSGQEGGNDGGVLWLSTFNNDITIDGGIMANGVIKSGSGGDVSLSTDSNITIKEADFLQANAITGGNGGSIRLEGNDIVFSEGARIGTTVVPIPGAIWLFVSGLIGFFGIRKRISYA